MLLISWMKLGRRLENGMVLVCVEVDVQGGEGGLIYGLEEVRTHDFSTLGGQVVHMHAI